MLEGTSSTEALFTKPGLMESDILAFQKIRIGTLVHAHLSLSQGILPPPLPLPSPPLGRSCLLLVGSCFWGSRLGRCVHLLGSGCHPRALCSACSSGWELQSSLSPHPKIDIARSSEGSEGTEVSSRNVPGRASLQGKRFAPFFYSFSKHALSICYEVHSLLDPGVRAVNR